MAKRIAKEILCMVLGLAAWSAFFYFVCMAINRHVG